MKASKEDVKNAVLFFAEKYGIKEQYEYILTAFNFPLVVKQMTHEMFMHEFQFSDCSDKEYEHYSCIFEYLKEFHKNGEVKFSQ